MQVLKLLAKVLFTLIWFAILTNHKMLQMYLGNNSSKASWYLFLKKNFQMYMLRVSIRLAKMMMFLYCEAKFSLVELNRLSLELWNNCSQLFSIGKINGSSIESKYDFVTNGYLKIWLDDLIGFDLKSFIDNDRQLRVWALSKVY